MNDVKPIEDDLDDDFNPIPAILGDSTVRFMKTQAPGELPIPLSVCMKCGGTSFEVGRASHTTVARCVVCQVEKVVHDG